MLNYSQLQLRATQSRIIAAQLLGAFNAWLQHIAEKPAVELQTFIEYEWVANFAQPGLWIATYTSAKLEEKCCIFLIECFNR